MVLFLNRKWNFYEMLLFLYLIMIDKKDYISYYVSKYLHKYTIEGGCYEEEREHQTNE